MSEKFPYLAKQINGSIAESYGKGVDSVYEADLDFIGFLSRFGLEALEGKWLDKLGIVLGLPRPWVTLPLLQEALLFDDIPAVVPNPSVHALSTDRNMQAGGVNVTPSMGGRLDDTNRDMTVEPITDAVYRQYLDCACLVKKKHSIVGIAKVVELFCGSKQYAISYLNGTLDGRAWLNDILIKIPTRLLDYQETMQSAFDNMFTTAPKVLVRVAASFDNEYILPDISNAVYGIVGNNAFSVTSFTELDSLVVDVTLGRTNAQYQEAVEEALSAEYDGYDDIVISVTVAR